MKIREFFAMAVRAIKCAPLYLCAAAVFSSLCGLTRNNTQHPQPYKTAQKQNSNRHCWHWHWQFSNSHTMFIHQRSIIASLGLYLYVGKETAMMRRLATCIYCSHERRMAQQCVVRVWFNVILIWCFSTLLPSLTLTLVCLVVAVLV